MNLGSILLFLPGAVCVFWLFTYIVFSPKTVVYKKATRLFAILAGFFLFAILASNYNGRIVLQRILFEQVLALAIVPCFVSYNKRSQGSRATGPIYVACSVIPYFHLSTAMMVVFVCGYQKALDVAILSLGHFGSVTSYLTDRSQILVLICYRYIFKVFLFVEFLFFATNFMGCAIRSGVNIMDILKFFGGKHKTSVAAVRYFVATVALFVIYGALFIGKGLYPNSTVLLCVGYSLLLLSLYLIGFLGTQGDSDRMSLNEIVAASRLGRELIVESAPAVPVPAAPVNVRERADAIVNTSLYSDIQAQSQAEAEADGHSESLYDSVLDSKFEKYLIDEKMFLNRDISIASVAKSLGVSRDELADYVESTYGMTFINYLNMLRIDYAEQYILNNEGATQKEIANACGFGGASSFNTAFSKITGVTPKIWKDRYVEMSRKG